MKRFDTILNLVAETECFCLADIGCDHGYIPIEAIKRKLAKKAIACDIAAGPLEVGKKNIEKEKLTDYIELRLGDGLEQIEPNEADVVVIAGMGGSRILNIISDGLYKINNASLILQPQHGTYRLRWGLFDLGIKIYKEVLIKEGDRFYEIFSAKKTHEIINFTKKEAFLGNYTGELAQLFYAQKKQKIEKYIHCINDADAKEQALRELEWLESL